MNREKRVALILALSILAFLVVEFFIYKMTGGEANAVLGLSCFFGVVAIAAQYFVWKIAIESNGTAKSRFYGLPIARVGITYAVVQVILSIAFTVASGMGFNTTWAPACIFLLALILAGAGLVTTDTVRSDIETIEARTKEAVSNMGNFRLSMESICDMAPDGEVKSKLTELSDAFKYSDSVSNGATKDIEEKIEALLMNIKVAVKEGDTDKVLSLVGEATSALNERNRICKANK